MHCVKVVYVCAQAQALMLLRDWDPAPDACFMARVQAILTCGALKRDGIGKVKHRKGFGMLYLRRFHSAAFCLAP